MWKVSIVIGYNRFQGLACLVFDTLTLIFSALNNGRTLRIVWLACVRRRRCVPALLLPSSGRPLSLYSVRSCFGKRERRHGIRQNPSQLVTLVPSASHRIGRDVSVKTKKCWCRFGCGRAKLWLFHSLIHRSRMLGFWFPISTTILSSYLVKFWCSIDSWNIFVGFRQLPSSDRKGGKPKRKSRFLLLFIRQPSAGTSKALNCKSGQSEKMETTDRSSRSSSSPSPTQLQLCDSFDGESCPSPMTGTSASYALGGLRGLTHSETTDGLSVRHNSVYNQSARAWMWSRGTPGCKRALSEQSGEGHHHNHLWHPPTSMMARTPKRTSAPQVGYSYSSLAWIHIDTSGFFLFFSTVSMFWNDK